MPLNYPALSTLLSSLTYRPGLVIPHLTIPTLTSLSWKHAHSLGVRSIVIDKDNCLTAPRSDYLHPDLAQSWRECLEVFGRENVLIVSNSAGCGGETVGAMVVSRNLEGATVLVHPQKKPGGKCVRQVVDYFGGLAEREEETMAALPQQQQASSSSSSPSSSSLLRRLFRSASSSSASHPAGHILVIGDRITTDTVLAHRINDLLLRRRRRGRSTNEAADSSSSTSAAAAPPQAIAVLTTHLWAYEGPGNALMRRLERWLRTTYVRRGIAPGQVGWRRTTTTEVGLEGRQAHWWRRITLGPPENVDQLDASPRAAAAATASTISASRLPAASPPRDPTLSLLLSSSIRRLSFLPSSVRDLFAALISSKASRRTAVFFRDGWLLILRGCREGLNRPALVFGSESKWARVDRMRRRASAGAQSGWTSSSAAATTTSAAGRRSYSTSTRSTSDDGPHSQTKIPRAYLWGTLASMILLPAAFLFGTSLSARGEEVRTGEAAAIDEAVKRDEELARNSSSAAGLSGGEKEQEQERQQREERQRRRMLGDLEKRRYEIGEALGDVERKLVTLRGRMRREGAAGAVQQQQA